MYGVSLLPIFVATIAAVLIGAVWYTKQVFGAIWAREAGLDVATLGEQKVRTLAASALQQFVGFYILAHILLIADAFPGVTAFTGGAWVAILIAAAGMSPVIFEKKSITYFFVTTGYTVLVTLLATLIIIRWPWA